MFLRIYIESTISPISGFILEKHEKNASFCSKLPRFTVVSLVRVILLWTFPCRIMIGEEGLKEENSDKSNKDLYCPCCGTKPYKTKTTI